MLTSCAVPVTSSFAESSSKSVDLKSYDVRKYENMPARLGYKFCIQTCQFVNTVHDVTVPYVFEPPNVAAIIWLNSETHQCVLHERL